MLFIFDSVGRSFCVSLVFDHISKHPEVRLTISHLRLFHSFCFDGADKSNTQDSVSSAIQTPRLSSKYSAARRIFNSRLDVLKFRWNTVFRVWYITSNTVFRSLSRRLVMRSSPRGEERVTSLRTSAWEVTKDRVWYITFGSNVVVCFVHRYHPLCV